MPSHVGVTCTVQAVIFDCLHFSQINCEIRRKCFNLCFTLVLRQLYS